MFILNIYVHAFQCCIVLSECIRIVLGFTIVYTIYYNDNYINYYFYHQEYIFMNMCTLCVFVIINNYQKLFF